VKPPAPTTLEEDWNRLCRPDLVRPGRVAAGRARLDAHDWPPPLAVADALLASSFRRLVLH
jgi:hypothetical protein